MGSRQTANRAWHADGFVPQAAFQRREQFPSRGPGRHFPVIDHDPFASVPGTHDHEPAAADIAGFGERDGQRKRHRHGRVNRVAAALQRGQADLGCWGRNRNDHAAAGLDRFACQGTVCPAGQTAAMPPDRHNPPACDCIIRTFVIAPFVGPSGKTLSQRPFRPVDRSRLRAAKP